MRKLLFLPLLITTALIASTALVNAHANPVRFDPAPGAVLDQAPAFVTGWFTADIRRADDSFIRVLDPEGGEVQTGDVELSSDRRQMSVELPPELADGRYLVYWSTVDDTDDHPVSSCYVFFIGQAAADEALTNGQRMDGGADCPSTGGHSHGEESSASVEIDIPEVVSSGDVTMTIRPTDFTPRPPVGNETDPNFGHYHIYLNKLPVDLLTSGHEHSHENGDDDHSTDISEDGEVMWYDNSYTFTDLEPGHHTVTVVLNYDDHSPLNPPVFASRTFQVEGAESGGGVPVWALALGVIGGLVIGGAGVKLAAGRA